MLTLNMLFTPMGRLRNGWAASNVRPQPVPMLRAWWADMPPTHKMSGTHPWLPGADTS